MWKKSFVCFSVSVCLLFVVIWPHLDRSRVSSLTNIYSSPWRTPGRDWAASPRVQTGAWGPGWTRQSSAPPPPPVPLTRVSVRHVTVSYPPLSARCVGGRAIISKGLQKLARAYKVGRVKQNKSKTKFWFPTAGTCIRDKILTREMLNVCGGGETGALAAGGSWWASLQWGVTSPLATMTIVIHTDSESPSPVTGSEIYFIISFYFLLCRGKYKI